MIKEREMVHIILATYNGEQYVAEQLKSILDNTWQNVKITVCDDGSKDHTIEIVKEYIMRYPEKVELHQNEENKGVKLNFLEAVRKSPYQYLMFSDQDDYWYQEKIEMTIKKLLAMEKKYGTKKPLVVFADATVTDERRNVIHPSFHKSGKLNCRALSLNRMLMENKLIGCTMAMNGDVKNYVTSLPKQLRMHDWWIALIATSFGKIGYLDKALLDYRQHGNNVVGNVNFLTYIKNRLLSVAKQHLVLKETVAQGEEFLKLFGTQLSSENLYILKEFVQMNHTNFFMKRYLFIKHKYYKTGLNRNIGVFFLL